MKRFSELTLRILPGLLIILFLFSPGRARGDEAQGEISLNRCIQLALDNPETTDSIYYEVDLAEIELDQTDSLLYPHLGARYHYDYDFKQEDVYSGFEILLEGSYLEIPQNIIRRKIARTKLKAAEYRAQRERSRLIYEITRKYCELLKFQALSSPAEAALAITEMENKIAEIRKNEGLTLEPEMKETERKVRSQKETLKVAQRQLEEARLVFSHLLSIEEDFTLAPLNHEPSLSGEPEELIEWAQENRSDARAARELVELFKSAIKLAAFNRWIPRPELCVGYGSPTSGDASDWFEKEGFYIKTALSYTFCDWGEKASRIAKARRELQKSLAILKALPRKIRLEVTGSYARLQRAWAKTETALRRKNMALKNYNIFQSLHKKEEPSSEYDRARARLNLNRAEWELTEAICDETVARAALANAVELNPPVLAQILSEPRAETKSLEEEAAGEWSPTGKPVVPINTRLR